MTPELERRCLDVGFKLTSQRRIILGAMERAPGHPTAVEIYKYVKRHNVGQATVYRTVLELARRGVLNQLYFASDRPMRFELAKAFRHGQLIDARTGLITEFHHSEIERLLKRIAAKLGYQLTTYNMQLIGERMVHSR